MRPVLAIDPGGTIGWCFLEDDGTMWSDVIKARGAWRESLLRLLEVARLAAAPMVIEDLEPNVIAAAHSNFGWSKLVGVFFDILQAAEEMEVRVIRVRARDWQKATVGDPITVRKRASRLGKKRIETEHEADAIFMAVWYDRRPT